MAGLPIPSAADLALLDPDGDFRTRLADDRARLAVAAVPERDVIIHRLAGAAATFGYTDLGRLAIALDDRLREGRDLVPDDLSTLLGALDRALEKSG